MRYEQMIPGRFLRRPNRFVAMVEIDGKEEVCHVKNTGRCKELLPEGAQVWCQVAANPERKTKFDLITVKKGERLINMDSQAPNAAAKQWLLEGGLGEVTQVRPETVLGSSRLDFSFLKEGKTCFMEVKGVTLENDGVCAFPDAPTVRGAKHIRELIGAAQQGYGAYILFVIQMENVKYLHPNDATDPEFGKALRDAAKAGVQILAVDCRVTPEEMVINRFVPVQL